MQIIHYNYICMNPKHLLIVIKWILTFILIDFICSDIWCCGIFSRIQMTGDGCCKHYPTCFIRIPLQIKFYFYLWFQIQRYLDHRIAWKDSSNKWIIYVSGHWVRGDKLRWVKWNCDSPFLSIHSWSAAIHEISSKGSL